ncbi:MAG: hypothetical protein AAGU74_04155 [Bacillota bacterium]
MKSELAVIATVFLKDYVIEAMQGIEGISYNLYFYKDFAEVLDIYRSIPESVRGVLVSGGHPEYIIKKAYPNDGRVVKAFINDTAAIYKQFLGLFREYPNLTTHRIYVDIFEMIKIEIDDFLYGESDVEWNSAREKYFHDLSVEEIIAAERELYEKHLRLWQENRVDVCLTRFSSLVGPLEEMGVNVRFMYPSVDYIQMVCREVISQMKIIALQANQPGIILIAPWNCTKSRKRLAQSMIDLLGKWLREHIQTFDPEAIIAPTAFGYEVTSSRHAVEMSTEGLKKCWLQSSLKKDMDFPVSVGYGLGVTLAQARLNAMDASREAMLRGGESYLINEKDQLIGPMENGNPLVVSRKASPMIREVSSKTGLSSLTVQKFLSVMEDPEDGYITSQYLARKLSITRRSANRFLSALLENGHAEIIGMRRTTTKGRPERLYRLLIGTESQN